MWNFALTASCRQAADGPEWSGKGLERLLKEVLMFNYKEASWWVEKNCWGEKWREYAHGERFPNMREIKNLAREFHISDNSYSLHTNLD